MKKFVNSLIFFVVSVLTIEAQTVAPMVFGEEYRNIIDMDVLGSTVAVVTTNDAIPYGEYRPFHLAIFNNGQWINVPTTFLNNGILDSLHASSTPKVGIAPNGDIWVTGKGLYRYSDGLWSVYRINDKYEDDRSYTNLSISADGIITLVADAGGSGEIYTLKSDNFDFNNKEKKFRNFIVNPNSNYPYEPTTSSNNFTFTQKSRAYDPSVKQNDFWVNTPDDTILQFEIPTPNGERSGRKVTQIFAENIDEVWVLTDNSEGRVKIDSSYLCCAGIYKLNDLKNWETISDEVSYPKLASNRINSVPLFMNKLDENRYEFLLGFNPQSEFFNEIILFNRTSKTFTKTNWDIIVKNSVGFRASNYIITEYRLAQILEAFSKNQKSEVLKNSDKFIKFKVDNEGNHWFMSRSFILKTPPINHTTSVTELDLNQQFRIVTNPASKTISLKGKTELLGYIEILNLQGETLIKVEGEFNNISIRPFANGVYFVKKTLKDGKLEFSKFIKE